MRPFERSDYDPVIRLWKGSGIELGLSDSLGEVERALVRDPDLFLVAERNERLIGAIFGRFDGRRGWVNHLAVARKERSRGVGRELVRMLEERLIALGCRKVNLHVVPSNRAAVEFYRGLGYQTRDLVMMERWLEPPRPGQGRWAGSTPTNAGETVATRLPGSHRALRKPSARTREKDRK